MKKRLLLLFAVLFTGLQVWAQGTIRGKITDEKGDPVIGATIRVKGTSKGTVSDMDGNFKLSVEDGATLAISAIGLKATEKSAQDGMTVKLASETRSMGEVIVTAFGIKREKKALGYAAQDVKGDDLNKVVNADVMNSLNGKVAGLNITSASGTPGAASYVRLRGATSFRGGNQPLYIIDGVPFDNGQTSTGNPDNGNTNTGLNNNLLAGVAVSSRTIDINPNDIETMSVLKGPAAAAIYGIEAANGAIIITTKKGAAAKGKGKFNVNYSTGVTWDKVNRLPELQTKYAQGSTIDPSTGDYGTTPFYYGPGSTGPIGGFAKRFSWGPSIDTLYWDGNSTYKWDINGNIVGKSDSNAKTPVTPYDNLNSFFQTAHAWTNDLSLSGGNDISSYRFSIGSIKQNGIIPLSDFRRITLRMTGETKLSSKLITGGTVSYSNSGGNRTQQGSNVSGLMLGLLRTPITFDNANGSGDPVNTPESYSFADGRQRSYRGGGGYDNPYFTVNQNRFKDEVNRIYGNVYATMLPTKWLSITNRLGGDISMDYRKQSFGKYANAHPAGQVYLEDIMSKTVNNDLQATASTYLADKLSSSLMLGYNLFSTYSTYNYIQGDGYGILNFNHISNAGSILSRESNGGKRKMGYYGQLKFNYSDWAYLEFTGRFDKSSTMPNFKAFFYPAVSGSFVFSDAFKLDEKTKHALTFGRIRASYAQVGKDASAYGIGTYYSTSAFTGDGWTSGISFPFNGVTGAQTSTIGNPNITPERTKSFEIGTDMRFANNRLGFDIAYYVNTSDQLLLSVPIATTSGYNFYYTNAGKMRNQGLELTLNATPIKTKDFRWDVNVNYSRNRNNVITLAPGIENIMLGGFEGTSIRAITDNTYGVIYGVGWLRDNAGNLIVNDDPNDPFYGYPIADSKSKVLGNPTPKWIGGLNNTFSYKGFSLGILFDTKQHFDMWNGTRGALNYFGTAKNTDDRGTSKVFEGVSGHLDASGNLVHFAGSTEVSGAGSANTQSAVMNEQWYTTNGGGFGAQSEDFIENISVIKLRELSFGYQFNSSLFKNTFIRGLGLSFSGRNLWLKTKYQGVDPESSLTGAAESLGMDYFNNPGTKSYGFKLNVQF